jgi:hypothetical protein
MKLDLLTNDTEVDDAIRFVSGMSKVKIESSTNSGVNDKEESKEPDDEDKDQLEEEQEEETEEVTTNQVF